MCDRNPHSSLMFESGGVFLSRCWRMVAAAECLAADRARPPALRGPIAQDWHHTRPLADHDRELSLVRMNRLVESW